MAQLILTLIFYLFLTLILMMVFLMWRAGVHDRRKLSQALVDATRASTEAAKESAEAVRILSQKREYPP